MIILPPFADLPTPRPYARATLRPLQPRPTPRSALLSVNVAFLSCLILCLLTALS